MRLAVLALGALVSLALASPAAAEDPVTDDATKAEIVESLADATQVQGVCYGWELRVSDFGTGQFSGSYVLSDAGIDVPADPQRCPKLVVLSADLTYTSDLSEAEDSASWEVLSVGVTGPTADDLKRLGLRAGSLLDDGKAELTFTNAVLALPALTAETGGVPPLILPTERPTPPSDARATGRPGSDVLRERGPLVAIVAMLILGALAWAFVSWRPIVPAGPDRLPPGPYDPRAYARTRPPTPDQET